MFSVRLALMEAAALTIVAVFVFTQSTKCFESRSLPGGKKFP